MNRVAWPGRDSGWWLVAVGVAFTAAELLFVSRRLAHHWHQRYHGQRLHPVIDGKPYALLRFPQESRQERCRQVADRG